MLIYYIYLDLRNGTNNCLFRKKCRYGVFSKDGVFCCDEAHAGRKQKETASLSVQTASLGVQTASFPVHGLCTTHKTAAFFFDYGVFSLKNASCKNLCRLKIQVYLDISIVSSQWFESIWHKLPQVRWVTWDQDGAICSEAMVLFVLQSHCVIYNPGHESQLFGETNHDAFVWWKEPTPRPPTDDECRTTHEFEPLGPGSAPRRRCSWARLAWEVREVILKVQMVKGGT